MQKLFEFRQRGIEADGRIVGEHRGLGFAPAFYEELRDAGIQLDTNLFGTPREDTGYA
jgi:pilus assembly protein CpaF